MRHSYFLLLLFCALPVWAMDATMYHWNSHLAYGSVTQVIDAGNTVFGLASGALFAIDKQSEQVQVYSKQNGLNGGTIVTMGYDNQSNTLLLAYTDGMIDLVHNNQITAITDLQQKSTTASKQTNKIVVDNGVAYFCMPFGIMAVDVSKKQIKDTYYIGEDGKDVNVIDIALDEDSIYAVSSSIFYSAARGTNWMDFANWHRTTPLPSNDQYKAIAYWQNALFRLMNYTLQRRVEGKWIDLHVGYTGVCLSNNQFFLLRSIPGVFYMDKEFYVQSIPSPYIPLSIAASGSTYWLATAADGIVRQTSQGTQAFTVNGPEVNIPYRLKVCGDRLYMLAGQRWGIQYEVDGDIMIYDLLKETWTNIPHAQVSEQAGMRITDLMNVAQDPFDPEHFYVTAYGNGVLECQGDQVMRRFTCSNSPLLSAAPGGSEQYYVRCDGAIFDEQANLWLLNAGVEKPVHVATYEQLMAAQTTSPAEWYSMPLTYIDKEDGKKKKFEIPTPGEMLIDNRYSNWKWIPSLRSSACLMFLDDNSTPQYSGDDNVVQLKELVDQDGNTIILSEIHSVAQDNDGAIWIGRPSGLVVIPKDVNPKTSNKCERIKVPRNDGTGLADYLLETEDIKAIVVDGANRKWIGTAGSGLYLVSEDGLETIYHFTTDNSPLIDNTILSLAIHPRTGRVYIGTSSGLMSFQSDAASATEDYSNIYAYPNPVRPDYEGVITISGLMDETIVHITDQAGNLVCETRSNGGLAIWDGKTADGRKAASGVYAVFANESGGKHAITKILLMH